MAAAAHPTATLPRIAPPPPRRKVEWRRARTALSTLVEAVISPQASHTLHGVTVGALSHDRHLARMRAAVVLPTPRAPVNKNA